MIIMVTPNKSKISFAFNRACMNERKFNQSARYLSTCICRSENGQLPSSNEYVLVDTLTAVITSRFDTMKGTRIHTYIHTCILDLML